MKLLGLIRKLRISFSAIDSLLMLYFASVAWNSVTITDSNKLERVQRTFAALCNKRYFQDVEYHHDNILD
jgi:hypothetical protein